MSCEGEIGPEALGESGVSARPDLEIADRELLPDLMRQYQHLKPIQNICERIEKCATYFTEAASDLSVEGSPPDTKAESEALGLSVFPGIFDLNAPLNDLLDSFVSALLNEGYEDKLSIPLSNDV